MSADRTPSWMDEERSARVARGSTVQTSSYVNSDLSSFPKVAPTGESAPYAFPGSVVKGVKIIAWLMLLNTFIGAGFMIVSMFEPEGTTSNLGVTIVTLEDYFTPIRVLISVVIGVGLSTLIWNLVDTD